MKAVALYVLTALVTGLHNFYWLMNIVNGAPINLLNCTALLGSATLLGAAVLVTLRPRVAAKVGLAGSLLLVGFLCTADYRQPTYALFNVASNADVHFVPRLCSARGVVCRSHSLDCFYSELDTSRQTPSRIWQTRLVRMGCIPITVANRDYH